MKEELFRPMLSVIIPVYNTRNYLKQCIESIISQKVNGIEIILVDDGSTDGSNEICDFYANQFDNINVVHKKNQGASSARNTGISLATGKYIAFMDSDDFWNIDVSVEHILNIAEENQNIDVIIFGSLGELPNGKRVYRQVKKKLIDYNEQDIQLVYKKCVEEGDIFEPVFIKLVKLELIKKNHLLFREDLCTEDYDWSFRLMRCIKRILFIEDNLYIYRSDRTGSVSNTAGIKSVISLLTIIDESKKYYQNNIEEFDRIGKYELAHCAYLWASALGIYSTLNKKEQQQVKILLVRHQDIIKFSQSKKARICGEAVKIFGIEPTVFLLKSYMWLRKNNIVTSRKKYDEGDRKNEGSS